MMLKDAEGFEGIVAAARRGSRRRFLSNVWLVAGAIALALGAWAFVSVLFIAGDLISK